MCGVLALVFAGPALGQAPAAQPGTISGTVVDTTGDAVRGAKITLQQGSSARSVSTGEDGSFRFDGVPTGGFSLTITAEGFAAQTVTGQLQPGQSYQVQAITLQAGAEIQVQVRPTSEVAAEQLKAEEKQRVLGFVPNFYVSYEPNPAPLTSPQKYHLAWRASIDPVNIGLIGVLAGIGQASNSFPGFGQGAAGYGKRFGAAYGSFVTSTFISGALMPQIFHEDPRYLYKGSGSKKARTWYAIRSVLVCRKDSGKWGACYSNIFGTLAGGATANLFYAKSDRDGVALTFENSALSLVDDAFDNIMQEFVVVHFTHKPKKKKSQP